MSPFSSLDVHIEISLLSLIETVPYLLGSWIAECVDASLGACALSAVEARIDSEKSRVQMAGAPPNLYQLVTEKTRNLGMRTGLLIQNLGRPGYARDDEANAARSNTLLDHLCPLFKTALPSTSLYI